MSIRQLFGPCEHACSFFWVIASQRDIDSVVFLCFLDLWAEHYLGPAGWVCGALMSAFKGFT